MLVTTTRAAQMAAVSRQAIHKAIGRGELVPQLIDGRVFIVAETLLPWARRPRARANGRIPKPKNPGAVS